MSRYSRDGLSTAMDAAGPNTNWRKDTMKRSQFVKLGPAIAAIAAVSQFAVAQLVLDDFNRFIRKR
jgi:hypothetical protein